MMMMALKLCRKKLICSNRKNLFFVENANFPFCFDFKGGSYPQDRFGVNLIGNLVIEFDISRVGIFPFI